MSLANKTPLEVYPPSEHLTHSTTNPS